MAIHPITLANEEFEGENNAYLVADGNSVALIDTGVATPAVRERLEAGLDEHGYSLTDVDAVVLTHWHPDHSGLAGTVQSASGATVYVHEDDAAVVRRDPEAVEAYIDLQRRIQDEWGMPEDKQDELGLLPDRHNRLIDPPELIEPIADGDVLSLGGLDLHVHHTPGHAAGHCTLSFEGPDGVEAFVGDVILPVYTPNVGGADVRVDRPLDRYVETLRWIADQHYVRVLPGHRDPIDVPSARAIEIVDHHRERTERVVGVLREHGPADAWTVSAHLFGDLHGIHILHGPGEAYAHLDHLERHGVVERVDGGYRLLDSDPDFETLI